MKSASILSNSSPEILRPKQTPHGTLVTKWNEELDQHVLFFARSHGPYAGHEIAIASHHNGHSCNALASRMIAGDVARAFEQAEYIQDCGGMCCARSRIEAVMVGSM